MARAVAQRSGPPYLLIVMVFLFLIAVTLAVLAYMDADKAKKQIAKSDETLKKLAGSDDLRDAKVQQLMSWHDDPPTGEPRGKSVVRRLQDQSKRLTELISGTGTDVEVAETKTRELFEKLDSQRGLTLELESLLGKYNDTSDQLRQAEQLLTDKDQQLADKNELVAQIRNDLQSKVDGLQQRVTEMDNQLQQAHDTYQSELAQTQQDWEKLRQQLNQNISEKNRNITTLEDQKRRVEGQVRKLSKLLEETTRPKGGTDVGRKPDGKILKVLPQEDICYINLGANDRVVPGLSFSVYPPTGIPEDAQGKASLIVANVGETYSECQIVQQKMSDPVMVDDLVANLAFDPTLQYTFVIEGHFDLYGTGLATETGAKEVQTLIQRYGGKVAEEIDIKTDFVVLGTPPSPPPRPNEAATPQEWQVYNDNLQIYDRYNQVKSMADSMHLPILNANKFLAFIGYTPTGLGR